MTRRGQTLLELVIAAGILMVTVTAAVTLIIRTITVGATSQDKTEAINYAREGVEVIRSIRDSNWLKASVNLPDGVDPIVAWDDDGNGPSVAPNDGQLGLTSHEAILQFTPGFGWKIYQCPGGCSTSQKSIWTKTQGGVSFATQGCVDDISCTGVGNTKTKYSRVVQIYLRTNDSYLLPGGATANLDYLEVRSTVTWNSGNGTRQVAAETRLYNWK